MTKEPGLGAVPIPSGYGPCSILDFYLLNCTKLASEAIGHAADRPPDAGCRAVFGVVPLRNFRCRRGLGSATSEQVCSCFESKWVALLGIGCAGGIVVSRFLR